MGAKQAAPRTESYETDRRFDPCKARSTDVVGVSHSRTSPSHPKSSWLHLPSSSFDLRSACPSLLIAALTGSLTRLLLQQMVSFTTSSVLIPFLHDLVTLPYEVVEEARKEPLVVSPVIVRFGVRTDAIRSALPPSVSRGFGPCQDS